MGFRYLGGYISQSYNPLAANITTGTNIAQWNGVYTRQQQAQAISSQEWATDPTFKNNTLLLQADRATNGSQNNTFLDSSSNNFTITRNGNTTQGTFSPFSQTGWSNYFDGASYLTAPSNAAFGFGTGDYTVEGWVYSTTRAVANTFFANGTDSCNLYIKVTSGIIGFYTGVANDSTTALPLNQWNHIAVSRSGTSLQVYLNGTSILTLTNSTNYATTSFLVGRNNGTEYMNGYISNLRVLKGTALYTGSTITVPAAPLTAITNTSLLTCQSNRFVDNSSNAFAITVAAGTPSVQAFSPFAPQYQWTAPVIGGSAYFDGTGDYLNSTITAFSNGNFTIQCWAYFTAAVASKGVFHVATAAPLNSTVTGIAVANGASGGWALYYNNGSQNTTATLTPALNTWNHIAVVKSGTTVYLYINGILNQSQTDTATYTNQAAAIGGFFSTSNLMTGYISGFKVTNTADYSGTSTTTANFTLPTVPPSPTSSILCCNFTNGGIIDATSKNNFETVGNAQVSTSVVKYGSGSMYFDGTGDYLAFNSIPAYAFGSGDFTVEAWVYTTSAATAQDIICLFPNTNASSYAAIRIVIESSTFKYYLSTTGASPWSASGGTASVSSNVWYHVALVRSGTNFTLYVNGAAAGTSTLSGSLYAGTAQSRIGDLVYSSHQYFIGYMDDVRITNGLARYTANFTPPQVALPRQ